MIYKRGKVYWYNFRWHIRNADGTVESFRIVRSALTTNKQDAKDAEDEHRRALRLGEIHPADPWPAPKAAATAPLTREFAKGFLRHAQVNTKKGTSKFYSDCVERLLAFPLIGDSTLAQINGEVVSKFARYRMEVARNSVVTINGDIRTLRRMLNLAHEWGRLKDRIVIHELPQGEGRDRVLSFKEEAQYLRHASANLRDLAIIAIDSGARPDSELYVLAWGNVELVAHPETPHGVIHIRGGKSEAAKRSIPLTRRAADVLLRRKKEAEATPSPSAYVFPGDGESGHVVSFQHPHKAAIAAAKLDPFPIYTFRHTFGTRSAQAGTDKYSLAALMGHSSPNLAARYYIHVTESHIAAGFGKFSAYAEQGIADGIKEAFPDATSAIQ